LEFQPIAGRRASTSRTTKKLHFAYSGKGVLYPCAAFPMDIFGHSRSLIFPLHKRNGGYLSIW
jgi:hypothetical protein